MNGCSGRKERKGRGRGRGKGGEEGGVEAGSFCRKLFLSLDMGVKYHFSLPHGADFFITILS